jgi:amino acid adenylation domain-containing protein/non-ribosomal peptide synthase protein (TIGR01720 family)
LVTLHHIVTDEWSMGVFIHELSALYHAFSTGRPSPLAALPIQYADFAAWQREWLQGEVLNAQLGYWKKQLAGVPALLDLPTDRPRPAVQGFRGASVPVVLDGELTQGLKALSQRAGVTLFMTLLGAFMVVLARYSRQEDIVVGSPTANRTHRQTEGLIGFFVNTLVLRADLAGDPPFEELLGQVRRVALEAYAHQEVPFEQVVEALQPERTLSHSPLFQVMFALQNVPVGELVLPGLSLSPLTLESVTAKFDLSLVLSEAEGGLVGVWEYSTELFEAATIERLGAHFETLLEGIVADPQRRLSELPLLPEAEWQQVVVEWNATETAYPKERCIHQLFEAQVERAPEAVAVVFEDHGLSYRALNARANQLAHHLQGLGVGPEVLVGVCLERSVEMVIGLLGILKAGGAYVPLDPAYPEERLAFMLEDARPKVLLTQQHLLGTLPKHPTVLCMDTDWQLVTRESQEGPTNLTSPLNLAYVIYTSGSTGRPKGVAIMHGNVTNHNVTQAKNFGLCSEDRVLQFASISFDVSVEEIFPTWLSGATLVIRPAGVLATGKEFLQFIQKQQLTVLNLPTAYWHEWVYESSLSNVSLPSCLRLVVVGGETALAGSFAKWQRLLDHDVAWINAYGPTEATVGTLQYQPDASAWADDRFDIPLGRPLANTQVYVLDSYLKPVPVGVPGELYIGGVGLARGYLNRPGLTAERFIPNLFGGKAGSRLYRTGDLAHYRPDPRERCIHQLFEAQVERTPEAVAVVFEDHGLSYRALNAQVNQLAHHLQALGVGPEVLVGVYMERSVEMVVGLLGILKAGGAYVPLDPTYPEERLAFMLEDAQVPVLLTQAHLEATLPQSRAQVLCLDREWERIGRASRANPASGVQPDNLAYVIYTSGSTGRPKGVQIAHRSLVNFIHSIRQRLGLSRQDILLAVTTLSFDIAALELYLPLVVGAKLRLVSREVATDGVQLGESLKRAGATVMQATPATWRLLLAAGWEGRRGLKILCGGEALPRELAHQLLEKGASVWNLYGPTETTIWSAARQVSGPPSTAIQEAYESIGYPLTNTQVYVLDRHLEPVPIGVPGELCIGGAGLARGYLQRPELTPERFIPHPFSEIPGARLYKTGDLARYRPDGNIEFLGRLDHQVKIRGFRIELGEIEAVLGGHPGVQEACVVVREDHPGEKRLVAYVVGKEGPTPSGNELREFLKERLPEYMVPSAFLSLEALPLTPNGKVDRKALPAPEGRGVAEGYVPPCTPTEELLAGIWAEVLRQERVGRHDNFFALGGDSILCIQVIARAQQAGLQLTPKQLFQHQSIVELAAVVGTGPTIEVNQGLVSGAVPLTPIQRWFFERALPAPQHFNQAVLLEPRAELEPGWVQRVVQQLLVQHDALRLRFTPEGSGWRQVQAGLEEGVPFGVVDLSELGVEEQPAALEGVAAEQQGSLNLSSGPLLRVVLFKLGAERPGRLLIVIHHLVVDGVSWRVLLEDFQRAYQQLCWGQAMELPPKTTAFKAWAERLMGYGHSEAVREELDYWLGGSRREVAPLPRDYLCDEAANTVASAAHVSVALSEEQTRALLQEVPPVYHTQINDVLLTALVQSMAPWTGSGSLLLDLEGHGREELFAEVDLSRTVGWFTTLFPVQLELGAEPPGEALKAVKEQLRSIPKGGIGYGLLRYVHPDTGVRAALQALPQAEISFNYLGQLDQTLSESSLFGLAKESSGPPDSSLRSRSYLLEVDGFVVAGRLHLDWTYSRQVHRWATVERLARGFLEALGALIAHCQSPEAGGFTPSDFPGATLSQENLNKFITRIKQARRG